MESFIGYLRDELLNGEIFYNLTEAKVLVGRVLQAAEAGTKKGA